MASSSEMNALHIIY